MIQRIQNYDLNKLIKNKDCTWWIEVMRWRTKKKNKTLQHRHLCKKTLHQRHKLISERTYKYFKSTLTSSHRMKKESASQTSKQAQILMTWTSSHRMKKEANDKISPSQTYKQSQAQSIPERDYKDSICLRHTSLSMPWTISSWNL